MNILIFIGASNATTGAYFVRQLREQGHGVVVVSPSAGEGVDLVRPDVFSAQRILDTLVPRSDAVIYFESGARFFPRDIAELPVLTAWYAIDTHLHTAEHACVARLFDVTFVAQKQFVPLLQAGACAQSCWLPLAADAEIFRLPPDPTPTYDVAFVGTTERWLHPQRHDLLKKVQSRYARNFVGRAFLQEMAAVYRQARVVFNRAVNNDVNMRTFEAMASGALLITDRIADNGFDDLFKSGEHLVTYDNEDDLFRKLDYYLAHDEERRAIAARGRDLVLGFHTYAHRAAEMVRVLSVSRRGARMESPATPTTLTTAYRFIGSKRGVLWCAQERLRRHPVGRIVLAPARAAIGVGLKYLGGVER